MQELRAVLSGEPGVHSLKEYPCVHYSYFESVLELH